MTLVYAGVCSHAPGIVGRADMAEAAQNEQIAAGFAVMRQEILDAGAEAIVVVAAEHFANFFMDNMPSFAIGMADRYVGPIENADWLRIARREIPGNRGLSERLIVEVMQTSDISYAEEWKFDHGIMIPLHLLTPDYDIPVVPVNINCQGPPLTPMSRVWAFGESLRRAIDAVPEKIALIGTGGISHWPATPDSGKINEPWDREFLDRWCRNDRDALLAYDDLSVYADGGQGGFEIRTYVAVSAAARGAQGEVQLYVPVPIFAVGVTIARYRTSGWDASILAG